MVLLLNLSIKSMWFIFLLQVNVILKDRTGHMVELTPHPEFYSGPLCTLGPTVVFMSLGKCTELILLHVKYGACST